MFYFKFITMLTSISNLGDKVINLVEEYQFPDSEDRYENRYIRLILRSPDCSGEMIEFNEFLVVSVPEICMRNIVAMFIAYFNPIPLMHVDVLTYHVGDRFPNEPTSFRDMYGFKEDLCKYIYDLRTLND